MSMFDNTRATGPLARTKASTRASASMMSSLRARSFPAASSASRRGRRCASSAACSANSSSFFSSSEVVVEVEVADEFFTTTCFVRRVPSGSLAFFKPPFAKWLRRTTAASREGGWGGRI